MYINGCGCLCFFKNSKKNGLDETKTVLWASICRPSSQGRVTSVKSLSFLNSLNEIVIFSLNSFHWRQSFSEESITRRDFVVILRDFIAILILKMFDFAHESKPHSCVSASLEVCDGIGKRGGRQRRRTEPLLWHSRQVWRVWQYLNVKSGRTAQSHPIPRGNNQPTKHQTPADKLSNEVDDPKCYLRHLFSFGKVALL